MIAIGVLALLISVATVSAREAASTEDSKAKALDGTWLFDVACSAQHKNIGTRYSRASLLRNTKLTLSNGAFVLPNYRDWKKPLTGKLIIDPAGPRTVDIKLDPIDEMSGDYEEKYAAQVWPGTYTLDGDRLMLCMQPGSNAKRPTDLSPNPIDKLLCRLVRADAKFTEFPKTVTVKVVAPDGNAVPNASVLGFMSFWPNIKHPEIQPAWKYFALKACESDGVAQVDYDDAVGANLMARDERIIKLELQPHRRSIAAKGQSPFRSNQSASSRERSFAPTWPKQVNPFRARSFNFVATADK